MKRLTMLMMGLTALIAAAAAPGPVTRILPGAVWTDSSGARINAHGGGVLLHDGVYYWFGEHKVAGGAGNFAQVGVHAYSSKDLLNWRDEGIALKVSDDPTNDLAKGCVLERPKVIYCAKTGKFVMWFHLELKGRGYASSRSGVAVADSAAGPYRFVGSFRPNAGVWPVNAPRELCVPLSAEEAARMRKAHVGGGGMDAYAAQDCRVLRRDFAGGQMARDMTLFVDDDGKAYHVYASEANSTLHFSLLTDDYLKPAGKYARVFPMGYNEAPALFKYGGKYYLFSSGCTGWAPNAARLAVADSIWGPWKPLGNPCVGPANRTRTTFNSQSTFVLPAPGRTNAFIFMADRWCPRDAIDGRYVWLPFKVEADGTVKLRELESWDFSAFDVGR